MSVARETRETLGFYHTPALAGPPSHDGCAGVGGASPRPLRWGFAPLLAVVILAAGSGVASAAGAAIEPVVRGIPAGADAEVVALCPDIGEHPRVFEARDGEGLAGRLASAGYKVFLVDPWTTASARVDGFDGVVREVFPQLLADLESRANGKRFTWIGHGLCGFLPVAAAARPAERRPDYRWVALGTRFDWRLPSPSLRQWVQDWGDGEMPLPKVVERLLFTGLREPVGARASSVPNAAAGDGTLFEQLESFHRNKLARQPPRAVLSDLKRWLGATALTDQAGWIDYTTGFGQVHGPALLVAGASDAVAPPEDVLPGFERMPPAAEARFHLLSRVSGDREEYGHLGMLLSRHAARDVDGMILAWLNGRAVLP